MRSILLQMLAVTAINLRSLPKRLWLSLTTVIAVSLVVMGAADLPGDGRRLPAHHRRFRR